MKIKYEQGRISYMTICPNKEINHSRLPKFVGSFTCSECRYFVNIDIKNKEVTCSYDKTGKE